MGSCVHHPHPRGALSPWDIPARHKVEGRYPRARGRKAGPSPNPAPEDGHRRSWRLSGSPGWVPEGTALPHLVVHDGSDTHDAEVDVVLLADQAGVPQSLLAVRGVQPGRARGRLRRGRGRPRGHSASGQRAEHGRGAAVGEVTAEDPSGCVPVGETRRSLPVRSPGVRWVMGWGCGG